MESSWLSDVERGRGRGKDDEVNMRRMTINWNTRGNWFCSLNNNLFNENMVGDADGRTMCTEEMRRRPIVSGYLDWREKF